MRSSRGSADRSMIWRSVQGFSRGSSSLTLRRMATITSLRSSSARRTSRRHSSLSSASGEARNKSASQATLALTSVSRHFSPAFMSCRSMNISSCPQPLPISQRRNASAWLLSLLEWEMKRRGTAIGTPNYPGQRLVSDRLDVSRCSALMRRDWRVRIRTWLHGNFGRGGSRAGPPA